MKKSHNTPHPRRAEIVALLHGGGSPTEIARRLGVTKNVVVGIKKRDGINMNPRLPEPPTLWERLAAAHERLDRVLAATMGVGRIPHSEWRAE